MVEVVASNQILIFKTNIDQLLENEIRLILSEFEEIETLDFDFEDCDHILRIEASSDISPGVKNILNAYGYSCQDL